MNGLAVTILVGQLAKLCGFSTDGEGLIGEAVTFLRGLAAGAAVPAAAGVGLGTLAVILQRLLPEVPAVLVAVVGSIAATWVFDLGERGVTLVGALPQGFPPLTVPHVSWSQAGLLLVGAFGITLVSLTDTISTASSFAARSGQEVRGNHLTRTIDPAHFFPTLDDAVAAYRAQTGVDWAATSRTGDGVDDSGR